MSLFHMAGVCKAYRRGGVFSRQPPLPVLRNATLRIEAGECVALLGPTGCGKSTLGRILLGLEPADAGEVLYRGQALRNGRGHVPAALRREIQAVFQDPHGATSPRFTAFDVIAEPLRYLGLGETALHGRVRDLAAAVGVEPAELGRLAHRFSGGQLQRLCIARALAPDPHLILLDEAVSSLDVQTQAHVLALLTRLRRQQGMSYLFITHDLRLLRGFADRCYVMQDGQPVEVSDPLGAGPCPPALYALRQALLPSRPVHLRQAKLAPIGV
jgi:nickel transport system ATP-binding protein